MNKCVELREIATDKIIESLVRVELDAEEFGKDAVTWEHYYFKDNLPSVIDDFLTFYEALEFFVNMLESRDSHKDELYLVTDSAILK